MNMSRRDFLRLGVVAAAGGVLSPLDKAFSSQAMSSEAGDPDDYASIELSYLPAHEQIRRFQSGDLSPVDVLEAQIERIRKYNGPLNTSNDVIPDFMNFNGLVNAITYEHFDEARIAAKKAEERYRAGTARSLEGITVAVKDGADVKGWRTTMGTAALKDAAYARENGGIIDMLLAEGAILHIQTTIPELYLHSQTWSRLWGVTRNPWNLHYSAGGSSGGSGAALAAGFTTLATGSDMGGSIRIPSALSGVYGFRPPFGRVPTTENPFVTNGPMARTFEDMVLMQNAMTGPHSSVHAGLRPKLFYPERYVGLKGVKIALDYFSDWSKGGIDESVRDSMREAAEALREQGAIVEEVKLGWRHEDLFDIYFGGIFATDVGDMLSIVKDHRNTATTYTAKFLDTATAKGASDVAKADVLAGRLHRQVQETVFDAGCLALITPTLVTPYFPADNDPTTDALIVNGQPVTGMGHVTTYPWNLLNRHPVAEVPVAIAKNNVPLGMQVIGNTYDDLAAFRVAYGYSRSGLRLYSGGLFPDYRNQA